MKQTIHNLIKAALTDLQQTALLPAIVDIPIEVTATKNRNQGDFASNIALILAKPAARSPRALAQLIVDQLADNETIDKVEIAGPGFINFFLADSTSFAVIDTILQQGCLYGSSDVGQGKSVQIEFVSANPTGPLHVGHGRGAAYGATLANVLRHIGYTVQCEYYVNDAGRQMDILATSVWLRYLQLCGFDIPFPSNGYLGDYVRDIAASLYQEQGQRFQKTPDQVLQGVCADAPSGDQEKHIDGLIANAQTLLDKDYQLVFDRALRTMLVLIREDLHTFGVDHDQWFAESSLEHDGFRAQLIQTLQDTDHTYEKEGALWFRSTDFGDEKDRVIQRDNGQTTYFASDIAYHANKFNRGFDLMINIWGADHHGYIARVKASLAALGYDTEKLEIQLVQFANLYQQGQKVSMSTRSGEFVTLKQLCEDIGKDAARFFYVMRKADQHMDFDLDLARAQSSDNPVYYLQYAYARICSVRRQYSEKGFTESFDQAHLLRLDHEHEHALVKQLYLYPESVLRAAQCREPHIVINYLRALANQFHAWYNACQFIVEDTELRDARMALALAVAQVLGNGLHLIGVSAPEAM